MTHFGSESIFRVAFLKLIWQVHKITWQVDLITCNERVDIIIWSDGKDVLAMVLDKNCEFLVWTQIYKTILYQVYLKILLYISYQMSHSTCRINTQVEFQTDISRGGGGGDLDIEAVSFSGKSILRLSRFDSKYTH